MQSMSGWVRKLFVERSDLFLKLMNQRWSTTEELVNGMANVLGSFGITSGSLLDLCCGNGRISIHMAKKGFKAVGVDISEALLSDARKKAKEHGVVRRTTFLRGDVRKLKKVVGCLPKPFDVVVSAWTSIGFTSQEDDMHVFEQARELSREGAILFIAETIHTEYLSVKFSPTSYAEFDDMMMLENSKYDPITAQANTSWIFYSRHGKNLEFIDRVDLEHHVYNLSELSPLLQKAGWQTLASYGKLSTLHPMTPLTHMNIVARAQ